MQAKHIGALILLGAIWGASFIFIRETAHAFGPIGLMFLRVTFGGLTLIMFLPFLTQTRQQVSPRQMLSRWRDFFIMGFFNSALPFVLIAFSELSITASLAAILNSTTPLFTAVIAAFWAGERLTIPKIIGLLMGIVGVSILVGGSPLTLDTSYLLAILASLTAALCYGIGTVYASRQTKGLPGMVAAIGQLLGASAILFIPAAATVPQTPPDLKTILYLVALVVMSTSFAYLIYFYLLRHIGPTRTASVTFLVPIFGSLWGIFFLNEPFNLWMLVGMSIVFLSVGLVLGIGMPKRKRSTVTD